MPGFSPAAREARLPGGLCVALLPLDARAAAHPQWRDLAGRALVENLFYEPAYVLAGAECFGARLGLLVVADRSPHAADARFLALWPCRRVRRWGLPLGALEGYRHGFSIFGAPLIDRDEAGRALAALLAAPAALGLPRRLLMPYLPLTGPLAALVDGALARDGRRRADFNAHARGFLDLGARDAAARAGYLAGRVSANKTRQLARLARRMEAPAPVALETLDRAEALAPALDDYLDLEASGWKGQAGTAAAANPQHAAFLRRIVEAYGAEGRLRIDRLRRQGRSLAVSIGMRTRTTFWYFKICHAEDEARNSPGSQLVLRVTRSLLADPTLSAADSCAPAGLTMIDGFWAERRALAHVLVEAGRDPLFPLATRLERLRQAGVARVRAVRDRLRARLGRG